MSRVFHIGDLHLGHRNILKYREEFSTIDEHNQTLAENIKSTVNKRDTLWLHGDILFDDDEETMRCFHEIISSCQCIRWILGNHDTDNSKRQSILKKVFNEMYEAHSGTFRVHSLVKYKESWLSHAPIHPDELRGKINIHGHVHSKSIDDKRYYNVSAENIGYKPISYLQIKEELL